MTDQEKITKLERDIELLRLIVKEKTLAADLFKRTLHDWFTGMAVSAMKGEEPKSIARRALLVADHLMRERREQKTLTNEVAK